MGEADGNSPDEMSGRYGEVVRRTQARFLVPDPVRIQTRIDVQLGKTLALHFLSVMVSPEVH